MRDLFTRNKQKVRMMNRTAIRRYLEKRLGEVRYLGLPAAPMTDVLQWETDLAHICAVERGESGKEYHLQHNLMVTAFQSGLANRVTLLRGDMDQILLKGHDDFGNPVPYPFDVVSLDYSGGLMYKSSTGFAERTESIRKLIQEQGGQDVDFLLFISCNLDHKDNGEIRRVFDDINRSLRRHGLDAGETIKAYLDSDLEEARLKVYVPYLVNGFAASLYQCEHLKPIFYEGNRGTHMMNFSIWLKRTTEYAAGRPSRQTLIELLNLKAFQCIDGELEETSFGIPSVKVRSSLS